MDELKKYEMPDLAAWFWIVAGDSSRAWSSAAGNWVQQWDAAKVTRIESEEALDETLRFLGMKGCFVSEADLLAERARRLALGFNYDFGDGRGVHRIGTTEAEMIGWQDVTTLANAYAALGEPNKVINIVTDTGAVAVKTTEWLEILLAAAAFRQPIWAASFQLAASRPIPPDFTADRYWPASTKGAG